MTRLDASTGDENPAVRSLEAHAVLLERLVQDGALPVVTAGAADLLRHAVLVGVGERVFAGRREATGNHGDQ